MNEIFDSKPARFPNNNTEEYNSVLKFLDILDKNQIKPDPKLIDKFPNTDGECTITDEEQYTKGKFEIQLKTLPDSEIDKPKYQCELPFLKHCEISLLPVILIIVNAKNECAFWLHMDRDLLKQLAKKRKGKSVVVHIPKENIVTRKNKEYIKKWIEIVELYIQRKINSEVQEVYKKKYEELYKLFENYPKPIHTVGFENLKKLNLFIDTINNSLDGDFKSIKEVKFSTFWKISIAYTDFNEEKVSYAIIPIKYGDNDLLIREVQSLNPMMRDRMARNIVSHYTKNPIKNNPIEYAYSFIKKETLDVIQNQYIKLICNQLALEYLTDFYDFTKEILPIKTDSKFYTDEFYDVIVNYLPIWAEEYYIFQKRQIIDSIIYFDIEDVFWHILKDDLDKITTKANIRYKTKDYCKYSFMGTSKKISLKYVLESLNLLKRQEINKFNRAFPAKTYSNNSNFVWSWYTPETAFEKLSFIYTELPKVYDLFIETYFPNLFNILNYYSDFKLLIVNIDYKKEFDSFSDSPGIELFYLNTTEKIQPKTQIYLNSINCPLNLRQSREYFEKGIVIDNIKYNLTSCSGGVIDLLYDKFTLREYLYKILKDRFEQYFKTKTNE